MARDRPLVLACAASLAIVACGTRIYGYAPVTSTSAQMVGHPAAELPFPPDSPQGNVRLATLGLTEPTAEAPRSIHVRMVASNRGPELWVIDASEQELAVAVGKGPRSTFVRASAAPHTIPARVEIRPGQAATLDLYFPLPAGARDARDVPAFDALWTVHTRSRSDARSRTTTTRTPFERFVESSPAHNVPTAAYPYGPRTTSVEQPDTLDSP